MKTLKFFKYQATGNDFIMIDNRQKTFPFDNKELIQRLCHRRFGIGSDGIILIENIENQDFKMVFINPDASQSMCGNGGRAAVNFAKKLGMIGQETSFLAIDGEHTAVVQLNGMTRLKMNDVKNIEKTLKYTRLNTGSPHDVRLVKNLDKLNVKEEGAKIRYDFGIEGINVNFVEPISDNRFRVRTYERGVEDETFSCGTGAVAVAVAMHKTGNTSKETIVLETLGGLLEVSFSVKKNLFGQKKEYFDIWLSGEAKEVFEGEILCNF